MSITLYYTFVPLFEILRYEETFFYCGSYGRDIFF